MKYLIIGDYCKDVFIYGEANRLSPEAPIPVFTPLQRHEVKGMGGNVFLNLMSLLNRGTSNSTIHTILSQSGEEVLQAVDFVKFNKKEHEAHKSKILNLSEYEHKVIITLGGDGAIHRGIEYPSNKVVTMDVSGAGDTFLSALSYNFMEHGFKMQKAIPFANEMALNVVKKRGVASI